MSAAVMRMLRESGVLSALDEYFTTAMSRIGGETKPDVLLACALASLYVRKGHVCLDLPRFARNPMIFDEGGEPVLGLTWPTIGRLARLSALQRLSE